jgi:hypothetical protein
MLRVISFYSKRFERAAFLQRLLFRAYGIDIQQYNPSDLPASLADYCHSEPRGYGYWSWKPHIISTVISDMSKGDVLWYVDSTVLPCSAFPFAELSDLYIMKNIYYDPRSWCKPLLPCVSNSLKDFYLNGEVPDASVIGLRVSEASLAFVSRWLKLCSPERIDDTLSPLAYHPLPQSFKDHRHDQSLMGLAAYEYAVDLSPSLTQYGTCDFVHHRSPLSSLKSFVRVLVLYLATIRRLCCGSSSVRAIIFPDRMYL